MGQTVFAARRAMSGADSCARKGLIEKHVIIGIHKRHEKVLLYERYRAPNWKSRPPYIDALRRIVYTLLIAHLLGRRPATDAVKD
jgi:hypothetical protein